MYSSSAKNRQNDYKPHADNCQENKLAYSNWSFVFRGHISPIYFMALVEMKKTTANNGTWLAKNQCAHRAPDKQCGAPGSIFVTRRLEPNTLAALVFQGPQMGFAGYHLYGFAEQAAQAGNQEVWMLTDVYTDIMSLRAITRETAARADQGEPLGN